MPPGTTSHSPDAQAMWDTLAPEEQLGHILDSFPAAAWAEDEALSVIAVFYQNPLQRIRINARGKTIGVNTFDLSQACKAINDRHEEWLKRQAAIQGTPGPKVPTPILTGAEGLRYLAVTWGLPLAAVIQHGTEHGSTWHLRLEDGQEIGLGSAEDLQQQKKVRARIFEVTHHLIPRIAVKHVAKWDELVSIMGAVAEVVNTPELSRLGQIRMLLAGYCEAENCDLSHDNSREEWEVLAHQGQPFMRHGRLHLRAQHIWSSYARIMAPELTQAQIVDMLRLIGATRVTIMLHQFRTSRSIWTLGNPFNAFNGGLTEAMEEIGANAGDV